MAISTDDLDQAQYAVEALGIPFPILSDPYADVPMSYGVFNHFGDGLATGSVFIVDKQGLIRWSYIYPQIFDIVTGPLIVDELHRIEPA